jgi:hypothetical protein
VRQEIPENLSADGRHLNIYAKTSYGRRYLNMQVKLNRGEIEYLEWLREKRAAERTSREVA